MCGLTIGGTGRTLKIPPGTSTIVVGEGLMPATVPVPDEALRRIRGEYLEMPGLRLTTAQAQRLWNLDRRTCEELLGSLVDTRFLAKTRDGSFVRAS
jgi:hypothetical protein